MSKNASLKIKVSIKKKLLKRKTEEGFKTAVQKSGLQWLDWMANGSNNTPEAPPIRKGILAGSGSVFYGNKLLGTSQKSGTGGQPNTQHNGGKLKGILTFGFNTNYASRMHNDDSLKPGPYSQQAGNRSPGNEWVQRHLKADANDFLKLVAAFLDKEF